MMLGPHHLLEESCRRGNVTLRTEHELNGVAFFIDCPIQILASLPDLDVSLIHSIRGASHLQMLTGALVDLRSVPLNPAKNCRVIHVESALTHHLFYVTTR